jgi:hypothetical protein
VVEEGEDEGVELELAKRMCGCEIGVVGGERRRRMEVCDGQGWRAMVEMEVR